uniref:Transmembrane channel-like 2b n=1 Tax=Sinocyclocheilus rhinocerous TaxID=307959 RepID=A0A673MAF3_9TELE
MYTFSLSFQWIQKEEQKARINRSLQLEERKPRQIALMKVRKRRRRRRRRLRVREKAKRRRKKVRRRARKSRKEEERKQQVQRRGSSSSYDNSEDESMSEGEMARLKEEVEEKKKLIVTLRNKPWCMKRRLKCLKEAQAFVEKFEGALGKGKGRRLCAFKVIMTKKLVKFNRDFENFKTACIPWESRIKEVESHFGSSVASYFIFLRWMYGLNLVLFGFMFGLVVIPEVLMGMPYGSIARKTVPREEQDSAMDFSVLFEFGGYCKYSIMIGFLQFRLPLSYLLVGVGIFGYSLMVVIRTMASNTNEGGDGAEEGAFTFCWKLFTSWDYLIGNPETADNKFASTTTSFKESIVYEQENLKDENIHLRRFLRVIANVLILCCLGGSRYLIYYVVKRSQEFVEIVMSLLGLVCPPLFEVITELEDYHPRIALKWQLARIFALFLEYYDNYTLHHNVTENIPPPDISPADVIRGPCWETEVGIVGTISTSIVITKLS